MPLPTLPPIPSWVPDVVAALAIGLAVIAVLLTAWGVAKGVAALARKAKASNTAGEEFLTWGAAAIATGVSAQGMWRFAGDILGFDGPLRVMLFAFIEVAMFTSAVRAKRNMRENFSAGIDGMAVWVLTCLSAVLSCMDARSIPEAVFRLAAPLVAAWLWERGMAIERHRATGRKRIHWRLTPERVLVRVGLAEAQDRTAEEVDAQRRLTKVALAAERVRTLREAEASDRKQRKARTAMRTAYTAAHAHTGLGRDETMQKALAAETASLFSAAGLVDVSPASAWTPAAAPTDFERLANETRELNESLAARHGDRASMANLLMLASLATGQRLVPMTPGMTPDDVMNGVSPGVTEPVMFVPPEWTGEAPAMTPEMTPSMTVERVMDDVTFDVNNPAMFDLEWPPPTVAAMTPKLTPTMTPADVNDEVTEQRKADVMRDLWERERAEGRYPRVVDLANEARADTAQASRLRAELVEALPWRERKKANAKKAVNGSKPS